MMLGICHVRIGTKHKTSLRRESLDVAFCKQGKDFSADVNAKIKEKIKREGGNRTRCIHFSFNFCQDFPQTEL